MEAEARTEAAVPTARNLTGAAVSVEEAIPAPAGAGDCRVILMAGRHYPPSGLAVDTRTKEESIDRIQGPKAFLLP
jgi:hypothetical protein